MLHDEYVARRYEDRRFFVPCDSATSVESLASVIASKIGLSNEQRRNGVQSETREADVVAFLGGGTHGSDRAEAPYPTIIVLDNFESPWEPVTSRAGVEEFLARMAALENVTVVITLRGTERPANVNWEHPLLAPLHVLDGQASRDLFLSISDVEYPREINEETSEIKNKIT